ncbi:VIT1/CCC1 transporter family protein [Bacteroides nordii]|uniref:Rubrerythrin family protein n=2 Tax=Bacteroides nordii TaxID=291645 RepID=A0A413V7R6_9BACE|nr:VIT1/CCC1 transporter family protein [Bacteroides nordii]MBD9110903.1 rubrerythrin family protein [Bacteroides nordii]MCE8466185.1 VIT1/CCC1 transporter family protein [Bacteroides nordii]RHB29642.1 rubrerythrin family protein [Bacteroides nordii]UYU47686.1 VIT1/CCC1 transporter family protein [Bacteroides nordii]
MNLTSKDLKKFIRFQRNEYTESIVYDRLASIEKNTSNSKVLRMISAEEKAHYYTLKKYTNTEVKPNRWRIAKYYWLARILGITFAIKLMESSENSAHQEYARYTECEDLQRLSREEEIHEEKLIGLINEERLEYMGSVVLGLNDALVEFTGALAGFTLALSDHKLIALTGSITGIAAALSMASSEYLSTKSEGDKSKHPAKAAIYTGIAYIITVVALVTPFILISNVLIALGVMLAMALIIIALFNYYYSVARGESFRKRFMEMAVLSFSVAGISFLIGYALKTFTGIDV